MAFPAYFKNTRVAVLHHLREACIGVPSRQSKNALTGRFGRETWDGWKHDTDSCRSHGRAKFTANADKKELVKKQTALAEFSTLHVFYF